MRSILITTLCIATLGAAACARGNNAQLADLHVELQAERELLKETREELKALIKKLEPLLAMAGRMEGPLENEPKDAHPVEPSERYPREVDEGIMRLSDTEVRMSRDLLDQVLADPNTMARGARIVPSIKSGKANGFKLYAVRPSSIYAKIGVMNGDTIHSINGMDLTTPDKALDVYVKIRNESEITLDITRRGKPATLTIFVD